MRRNDDAPSPKTVDKYLKALPKEFQQVCAALREAIKSAAPQAEEVISYGIPTYKYKGALVHWGAFKNHCSFFGVSKKMLAAFAEDLKPFTTNTTTLHFTPDNPLPSALVKKMVKMRMQENEALVDAKKAGKAKVEAKAKK